MAPSEDVGQRNRRKGQQGGSDEVASRAHVQLTAPRFSQSSLRPEFTQAKPGQQFGFRIPDQVGSQAKDDTQAPPRARFRGIPSQPASNGSGPPSSQFTSLLSGDSSRKVSTAPTSHAPSICSSTGERRLAAQRFSSSSQRARSPAASTSRISAAGDLSLAHPQSDAGRSKRTYGLRLNTSRSGRDPSVAPDPDDRGDMQVSRSSQNIPAYCANPILPCEIDEASPSEDDRAAEEALRRREGVH